MDIKQMQDALVKALHESEEIRQSYAGKSEAMSAEDFNRYEQFIDEAEDLKKQIAVAHRAEAVKSFASSATTMPGLVGSASAGDVSGEDAAIKSAFRDYLKGVSRMDMAPTAIKALSSIEGSAGGFLVMPQQMALQLLVNVKDQVFIRSLANVMTMEKSESLGVPSLDNDLGDVEWTAELQTGSEDTVKPFGKRALTPHPLARRVKISNKLLRQAFLDPEALVIDRLSYKVARVEENAFLYGDGSDKPLGLFTVSSNGIDASRDVSSATAGALKADDFIAAKHALKGQYWPTARWIIHRLTISQIRQLKDTAGNYLWQPGVGGFVAQGTSLVSANPDMIQGQPVIVSEFAPLPNGAGNTSFTSGQYVAILGDYRHYWIVDALDMQIQRVQELYAEQNQTGYILRKETDAAPVLPEAFVRLKVQ